MDIASLPRISPDTRFEVKIDVWYDRAAPERDTVVIECASQREIVRFNEPMDAGFRPDGILLLDSPTWLGRILQFDPERCLLRDRDDSPWMPMDLARLGWQAYTRGWNLGREYASGSFADGFPWIEGGLMLAAIIALGFLVRFEFIDLPARLTLIAVAALGAAFFAWFFALGLRCWLRARRQRRPPPSRAAS